MIAGALKPASFDPDADDRRPGSRTEIDEVEAGAIGIYGEVIGTRDFATARWKWERTARPLVKERHRREARACLRAARDFSTGASP